jgi:adenosylmethionine-8-amino-7-oxononanoate aminotransferase
MAYHAWVLRGESQRTVFVALEGSYHGDTFGAMAVGDPDSFFTTFEELLFEVVHVPATEGAIGEALEKLGERACGVIMEPRVQGAAGMKFHSAEFLREARAACDRFGVPLIADEVMTGFGRTGKLFACDTAGVAPDLLCLAKGLTGGVFPLSATLAREEMFETFLSEDRARAFLHGHTFTAHPVGCAVALESLQLNEENDVPGRLDAIGSRIAAHLQAEIGDLDYVTSMRQLGGIVAFDLDPGDTDSSYFSDIPPQLRKRALELGVLLRPLGNVIYALPPACTTAAECDRIAGAMCDLARLAGEKLFR